MIIDPWIWVGICILIAYTIEAVTGFGSLVIALSLAALMLPLPEVMPVLVPLSVLLSGFLAWRNRRHIDWRLLLRMILPLMLTGTLVGYLVHTGLDDQLLKLLFGLLIVWFAGRELWRLARGVVAQAHPAWLSRTLTFAAGITHGLFASGGPLLVYAMAGTHLDKSRLRATMLSVWFTLNASLSLLFLFQGTLLPALPHTLTYVPLLIIGILLGEWLHHRVDETRFRQIVYTMLTLTGALLVMHAW